MAKTLNLKIDKLTPQDKAEICRHIHKLVGVSPEQVKEAAKKLSFKIVMHSDGTVTRG